MVSTGNTYWFRNPWGEPGKKHLYFVINNPDKDEFILLVNMTERGNISDESCILQPGEHSCINKESVINYGQWFLISPQNFQLGIRDNILIPEVQASPGLIKKIQKGAINSPHFPSRYQEIVMRMYRDDM